MRRTWKPFTMVAGATAAIAMLNGYLPQAASASEADCAWDGVIYKCTQITNSASSAGVIGVVYGTASGEYDPKVKNTPVEGCYYHGYGSQNPWKAWQWCASSLLGKGKRSPDGWDADVVVVAKGCKVQYSIRRPRPIPTAGLTRPTSFA